jgi:hypothetical protein
MKPESMLAAALLRLADFENTIADEPSKHLRKILRADRKRRVAHLRGLVMQIPGAKEALNLDGKLRT